MKISVVCSTLFTLTGAIGTFVVVAHAQSPASALTDRIVVKPMATPVTTGTPMPRVQPFPPGTSLPHSQASNLTYDGMSFSQIKGKIAEAKRVLQTRPLTTAATEPNVFVNTIRIAFYDTQQKDIDTVVMSKELFLTPALSTPLITSDGNQVFVRTIRGNGVNTPVVITGLNGAAHLPLVVQYPRENRGVYSEMAYYVSTHPGLITPEVVNAGRFYVANVIDIARDRLRAKGYTIQSRIADIAERLATVEHVDHMRFRTEFHSNIYNDIFTLFALNEGNTYRYSVSSAGAGGMVQMIAPTYRMVRARFPNAGLMPDFVEGMRNHVNAAEAMLLYMQMTWNDLSASPTISDALHAGIASQEHLMAAGYNSNPAKLPGYVKRGGANWTALIPRETKIYLQIWDSLVRTVAQPPRKL